jgi:hypothetical protein
MHQKATAASSLEPNGNGASAVAANSSDGATTPAFLPFRAMRREGTTAASDLPIRNMKKEQIEL